MNKITGYFAAERYTRGRLLWLLLGSLIVLVPVACAFANGLILPRALGLVLLLYVACVALAVSVILRRARVEVEASANRLDQFPDDAMRRKYRGRIRRLELYVAILVLLLVYGLWATRDDPWPPKLFGAAINLLFEAVMIRSIRRMQKQLKEASDRY